MTLAWVPIALGAFLIGLVLYRRAGEQSDTAADTLALGSAVFWSIAGVFAIIGGFTWLGAGIIIVFTYIGLGKQQAVRNHYEREVRDRRA